MHQSRFPYYQRALTPGIRNSVSFNFRNQNFYKRLPPQNYDIEHWCETCDRSFPTPDLLAKHKLQHQKCNIDGCQFIAHPKVITKHIQMQHASGIYKKIANINNPEEIKKWREERKKKYPTKENIEKKEAEIKEKIDRGEKLGLKYDGHYKTGNNKRKIGFKNQNYQPKRHRPSGQNKTPVLNNNNKNPILPQKKLDFPVVSNLRKLQAFTGIRDIIKECTEKDQSEETECSFEINDDEDTEQVKPVDPAPMNSVPMVCGALSSLMCDYESSDDEIKEVINTKEIAFPNDTKNIKLVNNISTEIKSKQITGHTSTTQNEIVGESDEETGPQEIKILKEVETVKVANDDNIVPKSVCKIAKGKKTHIGNVKRVYFQKPKLKVPSTLLQKLLHREIQQERNIVLQCIRYIVKNNFFDKSD